jgi:hypothetical protein
VPPGSYLALLIPPARTLTVLVLLVLWGVWHIPVVDSLGPASPHHASGEPCHPGAQFCVAGWKR